MTRQFLSDQPTPPANENPAPAATPTVSPASAKPLYQDALAGAFPAWDLLPATPFIRRVK